MNFFVPQQLENLLVANWTKFLDVSGLFKFVEELAVSFRDTFPILDEEKPPRGKSLNLSKCEWTGRGFVIWADFVVPLDQYRLEGTAELLLAPDGNTTCLGTSGVRFPNSAGGNITRK